MKKSLLTGLALATAAMGTAAQAATVVVTDGGAATFAASQATNPGDKLVNFNGAPPAGVTITTTGSAAIVSGSFGGQYAEPFGSDKSPYLSVFGGTSAKIRDVIAPGYNKVSFYLGSIDDYNTIRLLSTTGSLIATFTGTAFLGGPSGNQTLPATNRLITLSRSGADAAIGGIEVLSTRNSAELDNVRFFSAVPEPSTWLMMILGVGIAGAALRRRQTVKVSYA